MSALRPQPGFSATERTVAPGFDPDDTVAIAAWGAGRPGGPSAVVLAGATMGGIDRTLATVEAMLAIALPVLVVVTAVAAFLAAGAALRPVEAIRSRVAELTDRHLDQRVPVPDTQDEIARLAVTMNGMLGRLQSAHRAQRQFIADAGHELRSPLTTITAGLELVNGRGERDQARLAAMQVEADRLDRLVGDLLLLATADEQGLVPRREEVDLDELLYEEQLRLRRTATVRVEVDVTATRVIGDRAQLGRVVRNLVDNAVRHAQSRVGLRLRHDGDEALLEVTDDGAGIAPADRSQVFERFRRLDDGRARERGGTGLGLAIVARVVAAHDGRVVIDQADGGGARVRVWLPVQDTTSSAASIR